MDMKAKLANTLKNFWNPLESILGPVEPPAEADPDQFLCLWADVLGGYHPNSLQWAAREWLRKTKYGHPRLPGQITEILKGAGHREGIDPLVRNEVKRIDDGLDAHRAKFCALMAELVGQKKDGEYAAMDYMERMEMSRFITGVLVPQFRRENRDMVFQWGDIRKGGPDSATMGALMFREGWLPDRATHHVNQWRANMQQRYGLDENGG